jgi:diguanylate cyclase (GGDEF)-like protein/PAS domain S-box-containing protein
MSERTAPPLVLVVDDDPVNRILARGALEAEGFRVDEAEGGNAALAVFGARKPDLVLLDVMMPDMDGFAVCARLRGQADGGLVPVLMLTGLDDLDSINQAFDAGATDFATKPVNWSLLPHRIRYLLRATRTLAALRESEERLANAQRIARLGYWTMEPDSGAVTWSPTTHDIFGTSPAGFTPTYEGFRGFVHPEDRDLVDQAATALEDRGRYEIGYRILRPDGQVRHLHEQAEVVRNEAGRPARVEGIVHDITERRRAEEEIRFLEYHDALTRLPNRRMLSQWLEAAIAAARRRGTVVAVCSLDLDALKEVNDTSGRAAGDGLLCDVADRLRRALRATDAVARDAPARSELLARMGGDEFIVAATDIERAGDSVPLAERLLACLAEPFSVAGRDVFLRATAGISIYPQDGDDVETLLTNAGAALHQAKRGARGRFEYFSPSINEAAHRRLSLESGLRKALSRGELRLHFQPLVDAARAVVGFEALARWEHPERGHIAPSEFIPVAEETGLIHGLGERVIREACAFAAASRHAGSKSLVVSVNVSAHQLRKPGLDALVARILQEAALPPEALCLEITESVLMHEESTALTELRALKSRGVRIAVDDFGTGYSSLAYLARFPVDILKVDRSFVRDLPDSPHAVAIVTAILAMARGLGLTTVAEGVETELQAAFLARRGCDEMQGYLFGRPVPDPLIAAR